MAATILPKVISYYMKNPKGARAQSQAPAATPAAADKSSSKTAAPAANKPTSTKA